MITPEQFNTLLPLAVAWAEEQELAILRDGVALTPSELADAMKIGVACPEKVRLMKVGGVPVPEHPILQAAIEATGLISPNTAGLTLRYGIFIRADAWDDRGLVCHELVHTHQYERMGGVQPFLKQYLYECLTVGYENSPLELEAEKTAQNLCNC